MELSQKVRDIEARQVALERRRKTLIKDIQKEEQIISDNDKEIKIIENAKILMGDAVKKARLTAKEYIEKAATDALKFVTQSDEYEVVIQENTRGNIPTYDIFIKTTVNGVESLQTPEDSNGGGFVDIVSVAIKSAFMQAYSDPKISHNVLYLDEPGKMVSDQMSMKFAEFIKILNKKYGLQIVMITHNNNIANMADKSFIVKKGNNGSEIVHLNDLGNVADVIKADVLKIMEDGENGLEQNNDQTE